MNIQDALKETGKAVRMGWAPPREDKYLWFYGGNLVQGSMGTPVDLKDVFSRDDWIPYQHEEERCDCNFCERADKIDHYDDASETITLVNHMYAEHLRKDHCASKGA